MIFLFLLNVYFSPISGTFVKIHETDFFAKSVNIDRLSDKDQFRGVLSKKSFLSIFK